MTQRSMNLAPQTLAQVPATVARPRYDRSKVAAGILHLGLGAFHRAHQAVYTDAVLADDPRWGIVGAIGRAFASLCERGARATVESRYGAAK